ncbi:hypothetical protein RSK20926_09517 [Roseobacter sp. SK209-2-6]|uniref:hypothetical protein n=1 Tax=Roseobacter sp. SK209-2-6 TaxID=388739 RepID=UPI0000F3D16C|nr:hypothetical protein [Roseobacter sp. SK209-2-6]EBA17199.1 hypothetical protein RSK20926_09517 [Roseobacter sp. SK209-2-6]
MKDIISSRLLLKAVRDLEASLLTAYETDPDNPETDFLNAAANVAFFSKIVFRDLVQRQDTEITACWALTTAIALGDFEEAIRFLEIEIDDYKKENLDLGQLRDETETTLRSFGRSKHWKQLLSRIDGANPPKAE